MGGGALWGWDEGGCRSLWIGLYEGGKLLSIAMHIFALLRGLVIGCEVIVRY